MNALGEGAVIMQKDCLCEVVPRLFLYILGPPHALGEDAEVLQFLLQSEFCPHFVEELSFVDLLVRSEDVIIYKFRDVEVLG